MNRRLLEELIKKEDKSPLVINMISKRVRQLYRGDKPAVEDHQSVDSVEVAVKEFLEGKLEIKKGAEEKQTIKSS
jgi:DNA-directed RNA polymerase subunit omega